MPAATLSLGPSFGSLNNYFTAENSLTLPNENQIAQANSESYTPTTETSSEAVFTSMDGLYSEYEFGSGFGSNPDPTISEVEYFSGSTLIFNATFTSSQMAFTTSDGVNTGEIAYNGSGLPTDFNGLQALTTNSPPPSGTVTSATFSLNGVQSVSETWSPGSDVTQLEAFQLNESGSFPGSLSSGLIGASLYGAPFTYPSGTISNLQLTQGGAAVATVSGASISYADFSAAITETQYLSLVLAAVSVIDASAVSGTLTFDFGNGLGNIVLNGTSISGSYALNPSFVIGGSGTNSAMFFFPEYEYSISRKGTSVTVAPLSAYVSNGSPVTLQEFNYLYFEGTGAIQAGAIGGATVADFSGIGISDILRRDVAGDTEIDIVKGGVASLQSSLGTIALSSTVLGVGDFNGDGTADILWRNTSGATSIDLMGSGSINTTASLGVVVPAWTALGVGDFTGNGTADILWRNASGDTGIDLMSNGTVSAWSSLGTIATDWTVLGVGDFTGDGTDDILWRNADGTAGIDLMSNGTVSAWASLGTIANAWQVLGVGDFTGDGTADILWRNVTTGDTGIDLMSNGTVSAWSDLGTINNAWQVLQVGDFNGDGTADILWRNVASGAAGIDLISGGTVSAWASLGSISTDWSVPGAPFHRLAGTGADLNGGSTADILWRNATRRSPASTSWPTAP